MRTWSFAEAVWLEGQKGAGGWLAVLIKSRACFYKFFLSDDISPNYNRAIGQRKIKLLEPVTGLVSQAAEHLREGPRGLEIMSVICTSALLADARVPDAEQNTLGTRRRTVVSPCQYMGGLNSCNHARKWTHIASMDLMTSLSGKGENPDFTSQETD